MGDSFNWQLLRGLRLDASAEERRKATAYYEELRCSESGWILCAKCLLQSCELEDSVKYFFLQIIEHYLRTDYKQSGADAHETVKHFLSTWSYNFINSNAEEKTFVRNKVAQLYSLAFVVDFPGRWPRFVDELAATLAFGERAVDLFLRVLLTIDADVVDREIPHTPEENARNTDIKDALRATAFLTDASGECGPQLADIWYWIITNHRPELVCLCLDVISLYSSWIDVGLIANQRYSQALMRLMQEPLCRESASACITAILSKGMLPEAKVTLVEWYCDMLQSGGLLEPAADDTGDWLACVGKLISVIGTQLLRCRCKFLSTGYHDNANQLLISVEAKLPAALRLLANEDDDVSHSVIEFCQEYVGALKSTKRPLTDNQRQFVNNLLTIVVSKAQYDESYDAESAGEEEAMFDEYRRDLKSLFANLVALDCQLVAGVCSQFLSNLLPRWRQATYAECEVAIYLLYLLGEFVTASKSNDHFAADCEQSAAFTSMMACLCTSQVSHCQHSLVSLRYFETIVRYDKFFSHNNQFIPDVLMSFLDERGLRNGSLMVRSRVSYLLSRFIKSHKNHLRHCTDEILNKMQEFLQPRTASDQQQQQQQASLSPNDQMFLFESAAILIVSSGLLPDRKRQLFESLLSPLLAQVQQSVSALSFARDEPTQLILADCVKYNIEFVSRASKAFSSSATMAENDCVGPFAEITGVFLGALGLPDGVAGRDRICVAVRGFLHRMVICLDRAVLPYVPAASQQLLRTADAQDLHDFYALLTQLVTKFKAEIMPFMIELLGPLLIATLDTVNRLKATSTRDPGCVGPLRKGYCAFLASLFSNGLSASLEAQAEQVRRRVLASLSDTVANDLSDDPVTCKVCVGCARSLAIAPEWTSRQEVAEFLVCFIGACLRAPAGNPGLLADAQTALFINEVALLLLTVRDATSPLVLQAAQASGLSAAQAEQLATRVSQCEPGNVKQAACALKSLYQSGVGDA